MSEDEPEQVEGVDFSVINEVLDDISYPITGEEIISEYGDREIERTNADPITFRELFQPMESQEFETRDDVHQNILTLMPKDSEGRQMYSDRGLSVDDPGMSEREDRPLPGHDKEDEESS